MMRLKAVSPAENRQLTIDIATVTGSIVACALNP